MFKLESYVTPLLLSYVDKYIKNLQPDDLQLSVWGGDAVLNNLDIKLDVLEDELNLPFSFVSGHIHELRIHVPWTKLGSESVVVTINTIECVLKLKDAGRDKASSVSSDSSKSKTEEKKKIKKVEVEDVPPSYMQSLISRVVNNVNIVINNLILKYVEDDIVLSLNVKSVDIFSVDSNWEQAFIDLSAPEFLLRKLIDIHDLTVCLDRRNASGKIEMYQDPLLYRCSLLCRIQIGYDSLGAKRPTSTIINLLCEKLDFSITESQLPMLLRLIELCLALYYDELRQNDEERNESAIENNSGDLKDFNVTEANGSQPESNEGWTSWAWSFVPDILPSASPDDPLEKLSKNQTISHLCFGAYVYHATIVFKLSEIVQESSYFGPQKVMFTPFLSLEQAGSSMEVCMHGNNFVNVQFGVSRASLYSQGECACGKRDFVDNESSTGKCTLMTAGTMSHDPFGILQGSLFDLSTNQKQDYWLSKVVETLDQHLIKQSEQALLSKWNAFSVDYIYLLNIPEDFEENSEINLNDLEYSNFHEFVLVRFFLGNVNLDVSGSMVHRFQKFFACSQDYDYEPYSKPKVEVLDETRTVVDQDEILALEEFSPIRTYMVTFINPCLRWIASDHGYYDVSQKKVTNKSKRKSRSSDNEYNGGMCNSPLPALVFQAERFDLQHTSPMYPCRLVKAVLRMNPMSSNLFHLCHDHYYWKIFGFHVGLTCLYPGETTFPILNLVPSFSSALYVKKLNLSTYWKNSNQAKQEFIFEMPRLSFNFTRPQMLLVTYVLSSWMGNSPLKITQLTETTLLDNIFKPRLEDFPVGQALLDFVIQGITWKVSLTDYVQGHMGAIGLISAHLHYMENGKENILTILQGPCKTPSNVPTGVYFQEALNTESETNQLELLTITAQIPLHLDYKEGITFLLINTQGIVAVLDPLLYSWLSYQSQPKSAKEFNLSATSVESNDDLKKSQAVCSSGRTITAPTDNQTPSAVSTSVSKETPTTDWVTHLMNIYPLVKNLLIQIEMHSSVLLFPVESLNISSEDSHLMQSIKTSFLNDSFYDTLVVCLPQINITNGFLKSPIEVQDIPVYILELNAGDTLPWTINADGLSAYSLLKKQIIYHLIHPISLSSTFAMPAKFNPQNPEIISNLSICIHADMDTITICFSRAQLLLFSYLFNQFYQCYLNVKATMKTMESTPPSPSSQPLVAIVDKTLYSVTSSSQVEIPENLIINELSTEDQPSEDMVARKLTPPGDGQVKLFIWLQWTLPKFIFKIYGSTPENLEYCFRTEIEDINMSIDIEDVFMKVKGKIGSFNITHLYKSPARIWKPGPFEGIIFSCREQLSRNIQIATPMTGNSHSPLSVNHFGNKPCLIESNHGFLTVTFTRAQCKDLRQKLSKRREETNGDKKGDFDFGTVTMKEFINEICIDLQPCDIVLWCPSLKLLSDLFDMPHFSVVQETSSKQCQQTLGLSFNSHNLPLVYINAACLRLFIPSCWSEEKLKSDQQNLSQSCDLCMLQVDTIFLTPQADNPLSRVVIRKDIYKKAQQMALHRMPGSLVEDRQYQLDISGIMLSSGIWCKLFELEEDSSRRLIGRDDILGQNPALEWNTRLDNSNDLEFNFLPLASHFDLRIIVAPAIVYPQPIFPGGESLPIVVCGNAFEVNVTSNMDFYLSTEQVSLLYDIFINNFNCLLHKSGGSIETDNPKWQPSTKLSDLEKVYVRHRSIPAVVTDSGIESDASVLNSKDRGLSVHSMPAKDTDTLCAVKSVNFAPLPTTNINFVSFEILLTACSITFMAYTHKLDIVNDFEENEAKQQSQKCKPKKDSLQKVLKSTDEVTSDIQKNPSLILVPFVYICFYQPHSFLSFTPTKQKVEMSCYDISINGAPLNLRIPETEFKLLPSIEDFSLPWWETKPGERDPKTGIRPSLYTFTIMDFLKEPADIKIKIERPLKINLSMVAVEQAEVFITALQDKIDFTKDSSQEAEQPTKSDSITSLLKSLTKIHYVQLYADQVIVALKTENTTENSTLGFMWLNCITHLDFRTRDHVDRVDEVIISLDIHGFQIKTIYCDTSKLFIGPSTISINLEIIWGLPKIEPLIPVCCLFVETDNIQIHFGQEHYKCLLQIWKELDKFIQKFANNSSNVTTFSVKKKKSFKSSYKKSNLQIVASVDDLRVGFFQYVDDTDSLVLQPNPYEIVFNNETDLNSGSMTWCYPEPRRLTLVQVGPVPFRNTDMPTLIYDDKPNLVPCTLQYWDVLKRNFVNLCFFNLSESEACVLDLENIKTPVVSHIWRVVLDDIEGNSDIDLRDPCPVSPLSLAACMRVDSLYDPQMVPLSQVCIMCNIFHLHFSNHFDSSSCFSCHSLYPFIFDGTLAEVQEFSVITLENPLILGRHYSHKMNIEFSGSAHCEVLEYRNLTLLPLVEPFEINGLASLTYESNQGNETFSMALNVDPIFVRVSQNTVHTLASAYPVWNQVLIGSSCTEPGFLNHFIICNETQETFRFGQVDTDENIILHCHEMHAYSWRSHKSKQLLHLCIEGMKWKWCEPFSIDTIGCQVRVMENKQQKATLIVKIKQLTNIQKQVIISGQVIVSSYLTQHLEVRLITHSGTYNEMKSYLGSQMTLPSYIVEHEDVKSIKLRIMENNIPWTQDIPITGDKLKENRLIKIPIQDKSNWFHIWCRVCTQKFGSVLQRLVLLLPLFVVQSHLPSSLFMFLETPRLKQVQEVEIEGKGQEYQLVCAGGDMTHNVTFHLGSVKKMSNPPLSLSAGMIEQVSKLPSEPVDIDNLCYKQAKVHQLLWPYDDEDLENEINEKFPLLHTFKKNIHNKPVAASKLPDIELQVSLSQRWPGCNSLLVDIKPRSLLINRSGTDIAFIDKNEEVWMIANEQIFTPTVGDEVFRIGVKYKKQLHCSELLTLSSEDLGPRWYNRPHIQGVLHVRDAIKISINMPRKDRSQKVCFLVITSSEKNNIRILTIQSQFNLMNTSTKDLHLQAILIPSGSSKVTLKQCKYKGKSIFLPSSHHLVPLLYWEELNIDSEIVDADPLHYIMLCHNDSLIDSNEDSAWSYPLHLHSPDASQRWMVAVPTGKNRIQSFPFTVSFHCLQEVKYLVINDDKYPQFLLTNKCNYILYFGQSVIKTDAEDAIVFELTNKISEPPSISPYSCCYYNFPYLSMKFPELYDIKNTPKFHLGRLKSEDTNVIHWSNGIDVTLEHDVFVNIPSICDVKVHVEKVATCIHIIIDPVNRAEISAKEIRSRIKGKETTTIVERNKDLEKISPVEPLIKEKPIEISSCILGQKPSNKINLEIAVECKHLCIRLLDDLDYSNHSLDVMRLCVMNCLLIYRPHQGVDPRNHNLDQNKKELAIYLGNIQIDNQMIGRGNFDFPVIFIRQHGHSWPEDSTLIGDGVSLTAVLQMMRDKGMVGVSAIFAESLLDGNLCIQNLDILLQPFSLYLEDTWAVAIVKLLDSFLPTKFPSQAMLNERNPLPNNIQLEVENMIAPVIFESLTIQPFSLMLSVHASIKLFIASDHTPLSFKIFERRNVFSSSQKIAYDLAMHYVYGTLIRAGWVVGSLDIIGNPAGLVRNISMGIVDFFYLPYEGITHGPGAFIKGVSRGASSLLQSISSGTLHSITNMAASVARNMDRLSFDEDYYTRQEESRRSKPNRLTMGLKQGLTGFGISLLGAVAGLIDQPLQTIQKASDPEKGVSHTQVATGIVSGMGKGLVGLVTKPVGGAAEFVSQAGQGLLSGTGWTKLPKPRYKPVIEDAQENINGQVKYLGKMLQTLQNPEVIYYLAATQVTRTGINASNYLLLTSEVLFVVSCTEDAPQQAFAISEIDCRPKISDSDVLYIIPKHSNKTVASEEEERNKNRVADYVETTGFAPIHSKYADSELQNNLIPQDELNATTLTSSEVTRYQFFVNPHYRNLFISLFTLVQNQLSGKGFNF